MTILTNATLFAQISGASLGTWDWATLGIYFAILLGLAWWVVSQKNDSSKDYFLAGKKAGWVVIGASLFASNIGSEHLVGLAGTGANDGMAMAHYELHAWCLLVLGWVMIPFYERSGIFTTPEFLEKRYSPSARWILSLISLVAYIFTKISVTLFAGGIVFKALFPIDVFPGISNFWVGAVGMVLITGLYTILGGLRAVLYTELLQTIVLLIGAASVLFIGLHQVGGWSALKEIAQGVDHQAGFKVILPAEEENKGAPTFLKEMAPVQEETSESPDGEALAETENAEGTAEVTEEVANDTPETAQDQEVADVSTEEQTQEGSENELAQEAEAATDEETVEASRDVVVMSPIYQPTGDEEELTKEQLARATIRDDNVLEIDELTQEDVDQIKDVVGPEVYDKYFANREFKSIDEVAPPEMREQVDHFNLWKPNSHPKYPWFGLLFGAPIVGLWYWCTDQYIVQRTLAAKSQKEARRGTIFGAYLKLTPVFIFIVPGMIAYGLAVKGHISREVLFDGNQAFPIMVKEILPVGLKGIVIGALLAALMSSLASVFNSCSTLFTMDIYKKVYPNASEKKMVWVGRVATGVMVLLGLVWIPTISMMKGSLYNYLQSVQSYMAPPIFAVFFVGVFSRRVNAPGCLTALIVGFVLGMARLACEILDGFMPFVEGSFLKWFATTSYTFMCIYLTVVCVFLMYLVSLMTKKPTTEQLEGLTYGTATAEQKQATRESWNWVDVVASVGLVAIIIVIYSYFIG